jgi:hypothetical protein
MFDMDLIEIATIAIGVTIGVFSGLMLFAWEIDLKKAVQVWLQERAEVRMALHAIEKYEERQNDAEYQGLNSALGDPEWDQAEQIDVARAYRTIEALGRSVRRGVEGAEIKRRARGSIKADGGLE